MILALGKVWRKIVVDGRCFLLEEGSMNEQCFEPTLETFQLAGFAWAWSAIYGVIRKLVFMHNLHGLVLIWKGSVST